MFTVEFENGGYPWWLAKWEGEPNKRLRSVLRNNAKRFKTKESAEIAKGKAIDAGIFAGQEGTARIVLIDK